MRKNITTKSVPTSSYSRSGSHASRCPQGTRFATVTNARGPGIKATDATSRRGLDLTTLRPEIIEFRRAKLPPTANVLFPVITDGTLSTSAGARIGFEKITNGVKQKLPGARLLGVENRP